MAARSNSVIVFLVQKILVIVSVVVLPLTTTSGVLAAPVVVDNPSFEDVGAAAFLPGWYDLPSNGDWTGGGTLAVYDFDRAGVTWAASDGVHALELNNTETVEQYFSAVTINSGDTVTLSFDIGDAPGNTPGSLKPVILVGGTAYDIDSVLNTADSNANPDPVYWVPYTTSITASNDGNLMIRIENESYSNWIDNVSVDVTPAATPEPGSFLLASFGLLSLSFLRRR
jgi:hypothetical protein